MNGSFREPPNGVDIEPGIDWPVFVDHTSITILRRLAAVLKLLCPRCLHGSVFAALWRMHRFCPACGLEYEREPGYFLGAMYFSYGLSLLSGAPTFFLLLFLGVSNVETMIVLGVQLFLSTPLIFRYSRVIWLHFDQFFDPR
jgi:uncharacterized protein (DUF983 family)